MRITRLPCDRNTLSQLLSGAVIAAIWMRRWFIRLHRDQVGDDRCHRDDWYVWQLLDDTPPMPLLSYADGMAQCESFYEHRRTDEDGPDTIPPGAIVDPDHWDDDLWTKTDPELLNELIRIQLAIIAHRDIVGRPRTIEDDRTLYATLPEMLTANFCLPSRARFLGEEGAPHAGCPSFFRSHGGCNPALCNQHTWGPCP